LWYKLHIYSRAELVSDSFQVNGHLGTQIVAVSKTDLPGKEIESVDLKQTKDQYLVAAVWISIVQTSMQSKEAYPTPNGMKGSTPR
jgi:hypothetical protein